MKVFSSLLALPTMSMDSILRSKKNDERGNTKCRYERTMAGRGGEVVRWLRRASSGENHAGGEGLRHNKEVVVGAEEVIVLSDERKGDSGHGSCSLGTTPTLRLHNTSSSLIPAACN